jgi:benzylsuccinate CoA-transferase BbsE subunit
MPTMLDGIKVLDLSDEKGQFCGKLLADMGADVVLVEPPEGSHVRNFSPFYHDCPDREKSLFFLVYNTNKRGITLDFKQVAGKRILYKLVERSDIIVETFAPGYMAQQDCGYRQLSQINPGLVMVSVTPFGQFGPYKNYSYSDLVLMGLGGHPYLTGFPDREPLNIGIPQSFTLSGSHGALSALIALWHQQMTGEGQHIDISMQECCTWVTFNNINFWDLGHFILKRQGTWRSFGENQIKVLYQCKDGYVVLWLLGGAWGAKGQDRLREWANSEGMADEFWLSFDYEHWDAACSTQEICEKMASSMARFFATKTKAELFRAAIEMGFFLAPVCSISDLMENEQLKERGFWVQVEHPELEEKLTFPGSFVKVLEGPPITVNRRAPLLGEHNEAIYCGELNISKRELLIMKKLGVI